jgi:predicted Zn-dependent protease
MYSKKTILSLMTALIFYFYSSLTYATIIQSNIPDLGQRTHLQLSAEDEKVLGQGILQKIQASDLISDDPVINEYLGTLSTKLAQAASQLDFKLHFFALNTLEMNAFAFFGGHIAVHVGLIQFLNNESELAAVLSHETAHIAQRHLARIMTNQKRILPLTCMELIGAFAIGALGAPDAGIHLTTAVLAGHTQQLINYTREHEYEADRIGIQILAKAGFNPAALPSVLQILNSKSRYNEKPPEYLLTHPLFESRIADCTNRVGGLPYHQTADSLFFHLVRARLELVTFETPKQRIKRLVDNIASKRYQLKMAAEYAYALALTKNRQYKEAYSIIERLSHENQQSESWILKFSLAEVDFDEGNMTRALAQLKNLHEHYPHRYSIALKYAETLLEVKQASLAEQTLNKFSSFRTDLQMLQLLVRIYRAMNKPASLHLTQAEWHFNRAEFKAALTQLDIAREYAKNDARMSQQIKAHQKSWLDIIERQKKIKP